MPVLNEEGILTLSPLDGLAGLTARRGAGQGEPDKYFPTRRRTFGRIVPGDDVQAAARARLPAGPGRQAPVPDPRRLPVRASPRLDVQRRAPAGGIVVVARRTVLPERADLQPLATELSRTAIDAHLHAGQLRPGVATADGASSTPPGRGGLLLAPSAMAHPAFTVPVGLGGTLRGGR